MLLKPPWNKPQNHNVAISDLLDSYEHPHDSNRVDYKTNTLIAQGHRESMFITVRKIPQEEAKVQPFNGGTCTNLCALIRRLSLFLNIWTKIDSGSMRGMGLDWFM